MNFSKTRIDQYHKFKLLFEKFHFLEKVIYKQSTNSNNDFYLVSINNFELDCLINDYIYFLNEFKMEDPISLKMIMFELKIKTIADFKEILSILCNCHPSIFLNKKELDLTPDSIDNAISLMEKQ